MKKLSEVTKEDAIAILEADIRICGFFITGKWKVEDRSEEVRESCKLLSAKYKAFQFWFFDDSINMDEKNNDPIFSNENVNYKCYIKAHDLGYYVPELSESIGLPKEDIDKHHREYMKTIKNFRL